MFTITDKTVHNAFDVLSASVEPAAAAKAMRERREYELKKVKAQAILDSTGTVIERESKAVLTKAYENAHNALCEAIEADEAYRNQRNKCELIIECWRSVQATQRAMGKVA